jgi:uncharacterized membrane protein
MSYWKSFGLAIFATVCLLWETIGSANAQCAFTAPATTCATDWSGSGAVNLGALSGSTSSFANAINDAGQAVGYSVSPGSFGFSTAYATEWSGGSIIFLAPLPGATSSGAYGVNNAGQVVGISDGVATEWSGGSAISISVPASVITELRPSH